MSSDDRIDMRDLPPVAPIDWPERLSQTLARWLDRCPRAGYLYVKTGGGAPTHEMDRGSLAHGALERLMVDLIRFGGSRYAGAAEEELSSLTAELVAEVEREHSEWVVSHEQKDIARLCAYHVALALDVDPESVVGIERKFVLELECGWTVSGKIDLASFPDAQTGQVDDYKTTMYVPPDSGWDPFQAKLYGVLLVFGRPVDRVDCPRCGGTGADAAKVTGLEGGGELLAVAPGACPECRGRGTVEELGEPIGGRLARVIGREIYPRHDPRKKADKKLARNERSWSRLELQEFKLDLEAIGNRLTEALRTWKFPARYSTSWCGECPAENECPIPRQYRRFAGHIRTEEEAVEAWAWAQREKARVAATEAQVKNFAATQAVPVVVGNERWSWEISEQTKLKVRGGRADWSGLRDAIALALEQGEPFELGDWIKTSGRSEFKKRKLPAEDVSVVKREEPRDERDAAERWGDDAPF